MTTYCVLCREPIPADRQRRGAVTCSSDHQREYRRQRRNERALRNCRLCGRKTKKLKSMGPVLMEHNETTVNLNP
jgi:hypothetical protein